MYIKLVIFVVYGVETATFDVKTMEVTLPGIKNIELGTFHLCTSYGISYTRRKVAVVP